MSARLNIVPCLLCIALVLLGTYAEDNIEQVEFNLEDKLYAPHILLARRIPEDEDDGPIVFVHEHEDDHDHTSKPESDTEEKNITKREKEIPLDLIFRINTIQNVSEFENFVEPESLPNPAASFDVGNRFGGDDEDARKAVTNPKPAGCMPELVTVPLHNSEDKFAFYYPPCTRIERCGGCCSHDLLSCQPTATQMITYQVIKTEYEGGTKLTYKGKEYVTVEQHTKCKCDCKVKEEDCNKLQIYEKAECRCVCLNLDEEQKCISENDTKLWDPKECVCACRQIKECSTGYYFDQKTCSCIPVPIRRRNSDRNWETRRRRGQNAQSSYKVIPQPVVPLIKVADNDGIFE